MHSLTTLLCVMLPILMLAACSTSAPPSPTQQTTSLFGSPPAPTSPAASTEAASAEPNGSPIETASAPAVDTSGFSVAAVVDTTSQQVTREQAQTVIEQANRFLREFSPIGLTMVDFTEDANGGSTADMANRYMSTHAAVLPNGIVIFSNGDGGQAKTSGGYGYMVPAPPGFKNRFLSPAAGDAVMYVAVVDYAYKYMPCGYGGLDTVQSASSLAGECRGQTGIACISQNGYSMCSNAAGNLYSSSPTYAVSSMIVHGLLHNFGPNGDLDHYATPQCNERMGYPAGFFDLQESEYYNGLCPYVYEDFTKAYQP